MAVVATVWSYDSMGIKYCISSAEGVNPSSCVLRRAKGRLIEWTIEQSIFATSSEVKYADLKCVLVVCRWIFCEQMYSTAI